ncbi:copper resistance CopC family protein [Janthinobacterium sp. ZB1P44]|uniref:copper resistance CopC family protein n=1 Tax=Janthinobacterium sp. ZB1P44 TaxID=3424192 RepID=UPI003F262E26
MRTVRNIFLATSLSAATLAAPFALAHASLKQSSPGTGASLTVAPKEIVLTFNEKVEVAFSTITLSDDEGKAIGTNKAKLDAANPAVLRLEVPALRAGAYTVTWAVAGHDGHRRKGDLKFTVQ